MKQKKSGRLHSDFDYATYFREMRLLHDLTTPPRSKTWTVVPEKEPGRHRIVLYLGCNVMRTSHMIETVLDVFDRLGVDYAAVGGPAYCCGILHHRNGDSEIAKGLTRNTIRLLELYQPEKVVMWCPSCIFSYDEIFQMPASFETQHVTEFLVDHLDELTFVNDTPQRVALHYHSYLARRRREAQAAERLLSAIPGLIYVPIGSDECLGQICAPHSQEAIGVHRWAQTIEGQLDQASGTGADVFATLYHGCQRMICSYEDRFPVTIEHYLGVVGRAMGIEHEDIYKKYTLWKDPERVIEDMGLCMAANGVREADAGRVVLATFLQGQTRTKGTGGSRWPA